MVPIQRIAKIHHDAFLSRYAPGLLLQARWHVDHFTRAADGRRSLAGDLDHTTVRVGHSVVCWLTSRCGRPRPVMRMVTPTLRVVLHQAVSHLRVWGSQVTTDSSRLLISTTSHSPWRGQALRFLVYLPFLNNQLMKKSPLLEVAS